MQDGVHPSQEVPDFRTFARRALALLSRGCPADAIKDPLSGGTLFVLTDVLEQVAMLLTPIRAAHFIAPGAPAMPVMVNERYQYVDVASYVSGKRPGEGRAWVVHCADGVRRTTKR